MIIDDRQFTDTLFEVIEQAMTPSRQRRLSELPQ
jgi:hypothetical protein